jgi:hypothetical protein
VQGVGETVLGVRRGGMARAEHCEPEVQRVPERGSAAARRSVAT